MGSFQFSVVLTEVRRQGGWRLEVGGWRLEVGGWRLGQLVYSSNTVHFIGFLQFRIFLNNMIRGNTALQ